MPVNTNQIYINERTIESMLTLTTTKKAVEFTLPESKTQKTYTLYYVEDIPAPVYDMPYITTGNGKTGIDSFNTLAGCGEYNGYMPRKIRDALIAAGIINECGTCNCNCPGCYAKKITRFNAAYLHCRDNTIYTRNAYGLELIYNAVVAHITKNRNEYFRIHDSGDFNSLEYMELWDRIAIEFKGRCIFYTYTKRLDLLNLFEKKHGRRPAFNFQLSTWPGVCELIDIKTIAGPIYENVARFEYDDGTREELKKVPHCPAVNKDGKRTGVKCINCLHCAKCHDGQVWAVYAHN